MTAKQAAFVQEYLIDMNATQAAIRAGFSKRSAFRIAYQLLEKTHVSQAIKAAMTQRIEKTGIDAEWLLRRLVAEVEADLADLYDATGALKPVQQWPEVWRKGLVAGVEVEELRVDGASVGTVSKIRLSDRVKRLELIGKHVNVNAFGDPAASQVNVQVNIANLAQRTPEEAARIYQERIRGRA
jgi:phage terminase small subunit